MLFGKDGNRLESCGKIGRALGITPDRLRKAVKAGELAGYSFTENKQKVVRIRKVDFEAWLEAHRFSATETPPVIGRVKTKAFFKPQSESV